MNAIFSVFPVKAGRKYPPLVKDWPGKANTSPERKRAWEKKFPGCNWGIHCADHIVIDVDIGKGGFDTLTALELEHGLPPTLETKTPTGGRHIFYSHPGGVANGVSVLGPGIDVRSNQGYVVCAPSQTVAGRYTWANDNPVAPAPPWLVELCGRTRPKPEKSSDMPEVDPENALILARTWLLTHPPAVEGQGGDALTYATCAYLRDFGVPQDLALDVLEPWNERCEPPWSHEDLQAKISNAYTYSQNAPASKNVEPMFDDLSAEPVEAPIDDKLYGPTDIELEAILRTNYLVKGWVERDTHALMFGQWGAGKTFIALHLAAHIAAGKEWFGQRVRRGGVLYFGYEGNRAIQRRLYALRQEYPDLGWEDMPLRIRPMSRPLAQREKTEKKLPGRSILERAMAVFKAQLGDWPALIIVDPLRNALGGSDSDADLTGDYLSFLGSVAERTGCATLTLHHPGHGDTERSRGDSALEAHMDAVIKVDKDLDELVAKKQRDDLPSALGYNLRVVTLGIDEDGDERTTCVIEQMEDNPQDPKLRGQQRQFLDLATASAVDFQISKSGMRAIGKAMGMKPHVYDKTIAVLQQKLYLTQTGAGFQIGEGPRSIFS